MGDHTLENELYVDNDGRVFYRVYLDATQMRRLVGEFQNNRAAVQSLGRAVKDSVQERRGVQTITLPPVGMGGTVSNKEFEAVCVGDVSLQFPKNFHPAVKDTLDQLLRDWHSGAKITVDHGEKGYTING